MKAGCLLLILVLGFLQVSLQTYNYTLAVEFAKVSGISYCDNNTFMSMTCGTYCNELKNQITPLRHFNKLTAEGALSYSASVDTVNKFLIFAFRGTNTNYQLINEITQGQDMLYDLYTITNATVMDYFYLHYKNNLRDDFISHLKTYRQTYSSYTVVFTGHSLGGALCTHAAMDAVMGGYVSGSDSMLYNYGSPRVGNYAWAQHLVSLMPNINRIVHNKDIVPHVPFCISKNGVCITGEDNKDYTKTGVTIWYAWHVWGNIWYNEDFTQMINCVGGEDPKCADQFNFAQTSFKDHGLYFVPVTCDGKMQDLEDSEYIFDI